MRSSGEGVAVRAGRGSAVARAPARARSIAPATRPQSARISEDFSDVVRSIGPWSFVTSVNTVAWLAPGEFSYDTHAAWNDASDYENHFTASGDARPTLVADSLDGRAGVQFDGVSNQLRRAVLTGIGAGSKPTLIVVGRADSDATDTAGTVFLARSETATYAASSAERAFNLAWQKDSTMRGNVRLGSTPTLSRATGTAAADGEPHWLMFVSSNASNRAESYCDGTLVATASNGAAGGIHQTIIEAWIGGSLGDSTSNPSIRSFKGILYELILFDGVPTSGELSALRDDYLAPTWPSLVMP